MHHEKHQNSSNPIEHMNIVMGYKDIASLVNHIESIDRLKAETADGFISLQDIQIEIMECCRNLDMLHKKIKEIKKKRKKLQKRLHSHPYYQYSMAIKSIHDYQCSMRSMSPANKENLKNG